MTHSAYYHEMMNRLHVMRNGMESGQIPAKHLQAFWLLWKKIYSQKKNVSASKPKTDAFKNAS